MTHALVTYHSISGHTKKMAEAIAKGIHKGGVNVQLKECAKTVNKDLLEADAIIMGSPTFFRLPTAAMKKVLDDSVVVYQKLNGKVGGVFTSAGLKSDAKKCLAAFKDALEAHGMIVVGEGVMAQDTPNKIELDACHAYGLAVAQLVLRKQS